MDKFCHSGDLIQLDTNSFKQGKNVQASYY